MVCGNYFVKIIKERNACEFSSWSTAWFWCHFGLINQHCSKADTVLCILLSPAQRLLHLCPRADALGKRREGSHQSSQLLVSAASPSPSCWLSLSPPVFRISTEAAAQMNENHCPCHLPWYGPPLLNENKYIKQLSPVGTGKERESHVYLRWLL